MPVIDTDTDAGKAELQKLIDAETQGLKDKNTELLSEIKKQKDSLKSIQAQIDELSSAKEKAEQEALEKSGDVEKVKASIEAREKKEREKLEAALQSKEAALQKLLVDQGLTEALTKAGVQNPAHLKAAKALILAENKAEIVEENGITVAKIGDQSLHDYVSSFAQGEDGKHFVSAPNNSGGGARGNQNGSGGQKKLSEMTEKERVALFKSDPEAYRRLKQQA